MHNDDKQGFDLNRVIGQGRTDAVNAIMRHGSIATVGEYFEWVRDYTADCIKRSLLEERRNDVAKRLPLKRIKDRNKVRRHLIRLIQGDPDMSPVEIKKLLCKIKKIAHPRVLVWADSFIKKQKGLFSRLEKDKKRMLR